MPGGAAFDITMNESYESTTDGTAPATSSNVDPAVLSNPPLQLDQWLAFNPRLRMDAFLANAPVRDAIGVLYPSNEPLYNWDSMNNYVMRFPAVCRSTGQLVYISVPQFIGSQSDIMSS